MTTKTPKTPWGYPLDRVAIALMGALGILMSVLIWSGDHSTARVRDFSWQNQRIGAEDTAFILTFSRPMDHASVEKNLRIIPSLPGKISWAGRRMAYTLNNPAPYGMAYQLRLQDALENIGFASGDAGDEVNRPMEPFDAQFSSRDRTFAYIGVEGAEAGRLILYNLTQQQKQVLTPKDLVVFDFQAFPEGHRLVFSAAKRTAEPGLPDQQIYTVTTGLPRSAADLAWWQRWIARGVVDRPIPAAQMQRLLDSKDYQNLKFDIATDGQSLVVQRVNKRNPADSGVWLLKLDASGNPDGQPTILTNQPGGDFVIAPDSQSVAIAQGQGMAILPLQPQAKALDFLPKFGMVLNFSRDGTQAAMVKFNTDYTRSLFLVTNQGTQKEILRTSGSILSAQFDPSKQRLLCLLTELLPGNTYQEQPFLAAIDLKTTQLTPLLILPQQRDIQMHLSPDGLAILFDQTVATDANTPTALRNDSGQAIKTSKLWLLPIVVNPDGTLSKPPAVDLPLTGLHPRWLP